MKFTVKVRINNCSNPKSWYVKEVGNEFVCYEENSLFLVAIDVENSFSPTVRTIEKYDCEIIEPIKGDHAK